MFSTRHVPAHDLMPPRCSVFFLCFYLIGLLQLSYNVILTNTRSLPQNVCLINFFASQYAYIYVKLIRTYFLSYSQLVLAAGVSGVQDWRRWAAWRRRVWWGLQSDTTWLARRYETDRGRQEIERWWIASLRRKIIIMRCGQSPTNPKNLAKISLVDVEIGLTLIVKNKKN